MVRNVLVIAPPGRERNLEYVAQRIDGEQLCPEVHTDSVGLQQRAAIGPMYLRRYSPPRGKFIHACYLGSSRVWRTVTPVILDGHSDNKEAKTTKLIQAALCRAGIEAPCSFTWQAIPFFKNCLSAHKYDRDRRHTGYHRPAHLDGRSAVHVQLTFSEPVSGPITIGAGRNCGLGVFAANC